MRDFLVGLQGEAEPFGYALRHVQERALGWHAIEGVVDFNSRELLGVETEHFAVGELLGIEVAFPLFIGVSRSPNTKLAHPRNSAPPCLAFNHSHRAQKRQGRLLRRLRGLLFCCRWLRSRRHAFAEKFDGLFQSLTPLPELAPEITLLF